MRSKGKRGNGKASDAARFALIITALLLPSLSLIPLGGLYLWENGYLLHWALVATAVVGFVYVGQKALFSRGVSTGKVAPVLEAGAPAAEDPSLPDPNWTALERKAWSDVLAIAKTLDIDKLGDTQALLDLGQRTINAVANRFHAKKEDAIWRFTLPEALAIFERVSGRLGAFVRERIPFGDRLTVSQVMNIYRWRGAVDYAERAYDIWRIIRLSNPATAVTNEARERLTKAMLQWGREQVSRQLAETYVEEVGRAAIDLYGGRLRIATDRPPQLADPELDAGFENVLLNGKLKLLIVAENADIGRDIRELFGAMEDERANAVAAYARGGEADHGLIRRPPLQFVEGTNAPSDGKGGARADQTSGATVIVVATAGNGARLTSDPALLAQFADRAPITAPVLLPVRFMLEHEVGNIDLQQQLKRGYPGPVAETVVLTTARDGAKSQIKVLWQALEGISGQARRIAFIRLQERTKHRKGWLSSARQAAGAAAMLAKHVVTVGIRRR